MSDLLDFAISAHGGWARWQAVSQIEARASNGGAFWAEKGKPGIADDLQMRVYAHRQHVEFSPFGAAALHSAYEPRTTAVIADNLGGEMLDERADPRRVFEDHARATLWDDQDWIYFAGYAMWTYMTTPFLLRWPGVRTEEIDPWSEDGEVWRRLKAIFPADIHSHGAEQTFYFGPDGILRRHDYSDPAMGGAMSANYALEPGNFDGIVYASQRRVYALDPANRPLLDRVAVSIDLRDIVIA